MIGKLYRWDQSNHMSPLKTEFSLPCSIIGSSEGLEAWEGFDALLLALTADRIEGSTCKEWRVASRNWGYTLLTARKEMGSS